MVLRIINKYLFNRTVFWLFHKNCKKLTTAIYCLKLYLLLRYNLQEAGGGHVVDPLVVAEGAAVPAGLKPDQGVGHGEDAEEQHHQQQQQVEVVVLRRLRNREDE